jgi:DNA-binding CsgD family transcriptional regulator
MLTVEDDVVMQVQDTPAIFLAEVIDHLSEVPTTDDFVPIWPPGPILRTTEAIRSARRRSDPTDNRQFGARLACVPNRTKHLLVLAALDGSEDLRVLQEATNGAAVSDLEPAERARLVTVDVSAQSVIFCHPEVYAEVLAISTSQERTQCHQLLARLLTDQPVKRAWHLAEAAIGPDEGVATLLDTMAQDAQRAGDPVGAISILLRAAKLGSRGSDRGRRLTTAAYIGTTGVGRLEGMSTLLDEACRSGGGRDSSLLAVVTSAYLLLNEDGDVETAHRMVVDALKSCDGQIGDVDGAIGAAIGALSYLGQLGARAKPWLSLEDRLMDGLDPSAWRELALLQRIAADPARATNGSLQELDRAVADLSADFDTARVLRVSQIAGLVDRLGGCREALWRVVRHSQQRNAGGQTLKALVSLSLDRIECGAWDRAVDLAEQGLRLSDDYGNGLFEWTFRYHRGIVGAARGETEVVERMALDIAQWATSRRAEAANAATQAVRGLASLSLGDFDMAYGYLSSINPSGAATKAPAIPQPLWASMDLVEAAMRTDHVEEAKSYVDAMVQACVADISPRMALLVGGSLAMVSPTNEVGENFKAALKIPGVEAWPFDLARVLLLYGEHLRRAKEITESRVVLGKALECFQNLRAQPWIARAASELRASGVSMSGPKNVDSVLTPQEQEITIMAASGMTNKEIGQHLHLSHRTVGSHLYKVFPKLGITSRMELRDALERAS